MPRLMILALGFFSCQARRRLATCGRRTARALATLRVCGTPQNAEAGGGSWRHGPARPNDQLQRRQPKFLSAHLRKEVASLKRRHVRVARNLACKRHRRNENSRDDVANRLHIIVSRSDCFIVTRGRCGSIACNSRFGSMTGENVFAHS